MQRFLPCNACLALGKDRYFVEVGPGFEPRDEMEICQGVNGDSRSYEKQHYMEEKQKSLISTIPPVSGCNESDFTWWYPKSTFKGYRKRFENRRPNLD